MPRTKPRSAAPVIERMLGEASWLFSHAQALADYGRREEAHAELARAALAEDRPLASWKPRAANRRPGCIA
jgi:hypothetical protein